MSQTATSLRQQFKDSSLSTTNDALNSDNRLSLLKGIIDRFSESSRILETRYQDIVHESNALREQLRIKDEQMQRATRLTALGEAAATIAHEIRNPLGAMTLMTSLLVDDSTISTQQKKLLSQITISINRLESFVADLLQFAKGTKIKLSPLNLHKLIQRILSSHHLLQNNAITIEQHFEGLEFIQANESAIERIISNLITNAVRAMNGTGTISFSCKETADTHIAITFRDSGPGISEQLIATIFEPFVSASEGGTGLGLAIVKQLVSAHNGSIMVKNTPSAEFTILLPIQTLERK